MAKVVFFIIASFFTYKIFIENKRIKKLLWVIIGLMLLHSNIIVTEIPIQMPVNRWLLFSFIFSELYNYRKLKYETQKFPLIKTILISIISSLCVAIFDPRLNIFYKLYAPFCEITDTYFIILLGYFAVEDEMNIYKIAKPIFFTLIFVSILGLLNWVTQQNPYHELVINTYLKKGSMNYESFIKSITGDSERYRASSTFNMTFNYGYFSTILALFSFSIYNSRILMLKKIAIISIFAGLTGTILCFSRTVLLSALVSFFIILLFSTSFYRKITTAITIIILGLVSYNTVPVLQKSLDSSIDIFTTGGQKIAGSSVDMRQIQFLGAYKYFIKSPVLGNGYGYINKELGWGDRDNKTLDTDMFGFESIVYQLMIEQGIIGLLSKLILFISFTFYFLKNRKINKNLSGLGLAIVTLFLFFSIGTGPLGAWPVSMLLLGIIIKSIELSKSKNDKSMQYAS